MIYAASRTKHAEMWRRLRAQGAPITSTWFDESAEPDYTELWERIQHEVYHCLKLVLYAEPDDFPLKGALVEVGMALGMHKRLIVCLPGVEVDAGYRAIGSWVNHPRVARVDDLMIALNTP